MQRLAERTDGELVELALAGDRSAFAVLYDRYVDAIHDHLARVLRDVAEAQDLTQDTFVTALEKLGQLSDPDRFKAWIYRIATNRAFDRIERRKRSVTVGGTRDGDERNVLLDQPDTSRLQDPVAATVAAEVSTLVWEAAESLDARTRSVLDLHVRQGLESAEIADVMGIERNHAYQLVHRMKERVEGAIGTTLLVRRGSRDCDELRAVVGGASVPPVDEDLRRSVDRHVDGCETCQETRRRLLAPMPAYAALAAVPPSAEFRDELWLELDRRFPYGPAVATGSTGPSRAAVLTLSLIAGLVLAVGVLGVQAREQLRPQVVAAPPLFTAEPFVETAAPEPQDTPDVITPPATQPEVSEEPTVPAVTITEAEPSPSPTPAPPPPPPPSPTSSPTPTPTPEPTTTDQAPTVAIRSPQEGQVLEAQDPDGDGNWSAVVNLAGEASDPETPPGQLLVTWRSDLDGQLAQTLQAQATLSHATDCATVTALVPTRHTVSLSVTDSAGQTTTRSVTVTVQCPAG